MPALVFTKQFLNKYLTRRYLSFILLSCALIVVFLCGNVFDNAKPTIKPTLLLNSGLCEAKEADLRINIWFESGKPQENLFATLPRNGWEWRETFKLTTSGREAYLISGFKRIDATEENKIADWFDNIARLVSRGQGIAYLDERIDEKIDIARYSILVNADPKQWALASNTVSIASYNSILTPPVRAGADAINVQLICRVEKADKAVTALALPVLLEEF